MLISANANNRLYYAQYLQSKEDKGKGRQGERMGKPPLVNRSQSTGFIYETQNPLSPCPLP